MRLNQYVHELLEIFEQELGCKRAIFYRDYKEIDLNKHIFLKQDKHIGYYARATHGLFIADISKVVNSTGFIKWQLLETYRIINTALVSSATSIDPILNN